MFVEILHNSQENACARASFLIKLQTKAYNFNEKRNSGQVFSCELCKVSKNRFFTEYLRAAASEPIELAFQLCKASFNLTVFSTLFVCDHHFVQYGFK